MRPYSYLLINLEIILILFINGLGASDFNVLSINSKFINLHFLQLLLIPEALVVHVFVRVILFLGVRRTRIWISAVVLAGVTV